MPKKKKPAKPDGDPEGGGEEGSIKSTLTAAMPGMDFDFGQVFQAQKLEGFLKGVMGKVHAQDETINALKQELNSRPTQKEMDSQRSLLFEHVSDSLKKKADTEIVEQVRAMMVKQEAHIQGVQAQVQSVEGRFEGLSQQITANADAINKLSTELTLASQGSVSVAKYDLLEFAQMQSCKEWRATGEAMQELTERCNQMQKQLLDKAEQDAMMALAQRVADDNQSNKEHAAQMEDFAADLANTKEAAARALLVGEREALAVFHTVEFEKKISDELEGLKTKVEEVTAGADDEIPDWAKKMREEINSDMAQKEKAAADAAAKKEEEEAKQAEAESQKEAQEAKEAKAAADKEQREAEEAAAAAKEAEEAAAREQEEVEEAKRALEAAVEAGNAAAIQAAEAKLKQEQDEANAAKEAAAAKAAEAEEEKRQAEEAKAEAEKQRLEAEEAAANAIKQAQEAEEAAKAQVQAAAAAQAGAGGGGGGAAKEEIDRIDRTMERLAGKVLSCSQKVGELLKEGGGGGGGGGGAALARLQEDLMLNTQKTENELDRMSEYLDKMSEQLASCWEQRANASELATLRADVDALLGQREGDVHQIKSVLTQMETTLRNPTLPSTAVGVHTAAGGVAGIRQQAAERGPRR